MCLANKSKNETCLYNNTEMGNSNKEKILGIIINNIFKNTHRK